MEWQYSQYDLPLLWEDACRAELEIEALKLKRELSPRGVWARLHGITAAEMTQQKIHMPGWASRALRSPNYRRVVELRKAEMVLEEVPKLRALKELIGEGVYKSAAKILLDLTLRPEKVSTSEARMLLQTLTALDERLVAPMSAEEEKDKARTAGAILLDEERFVRERLEGIPKEYHERLLQTYQQARKGALAEDRAKIISEAARAEADKHT